MFSRLRCRLFGPSRDDLLRWLDEGEPVGIFNVNWIRHSSLCAIHVSGHTQPCSCGAVAS
jgi:hypothetical protein